MYEKKLNFLYSSDTITQSMITPKMLLIYERNEQIDFPVKSNSICVLHLSLHICTISTTIQKFYYLQIMRK